MDNPYDDYCYECTGYGDDYYYDEDICDYVRYRDKCPFNDSRQDYDW